MLAPTPFAATLAGMATEANSDARRRQKSFPHAVKEFVTSIAIAFAMAFVFRGFVIEGFEIPTGSMAPTLLGKHALVRNDDSGFQWTVGPDQSPPGPAIRVDTLDDPITRTSARGGELPTRWGDRLFVLKYLRGIYNPARWDVVVFKAPHVHQNYIKRLIGMPGEQIAIADGDVFARPAPRDRAAAAGPSVWDAPDWDIARKPERVQRALWQPVFDSSFTPEGAPTYDPPWIAEGSGWSGLDDDRSYRYERDGEASLRWDTDERPITDYTAYNATSIPRNPALQFPVSDIAMSLVIEPETDAASLEARLDARGSTFRATIADGSATVQRRATTAADWQTLDTAEADLPAGELTRVEFWHADQALWLFVNGKLVAGGPEDGAYDATPAERIEMATGSTLTDLMQRPREQGVENSILADTSIYRTPELGWHFSRGPFTLHRVRVDRDIHYQITGPSFTSSGQHATRGAHPDDPALLSPDHFMFCGDNSPNSLDARAWDHEYPWVTERLHKGERHHGLTHRSLIIGRAFVVYFPSPQLGGPIPVFDAGRMRWVW